MRRSTADRAREDAALDHKRERLRSDPECEQGQKQPQSNRISPRLHIIVFFLLGNAEHIILIMYGPPGGPYELRVAPEFGNWDWLVPNMNNREVTLGVSHRVELYFKQTGSQVDVRWWMDDLEIGRYYNVPFSTANPVEFQFAPTWGGVDPGISKTEADYFRFDHVYLSKPQNQCFD